MRLPDPMSRGRRRRKRPAGFSLIEVLVALAIASGVLMAFYQASAASMALRTRGQEAAEFALLAEKLVNRLGADIALTPGTKSGKEDGLAWRVTIAPARSISVRDEAGQEQGLPAESLLRISILLFQSSSQTPVYSITTLRIDPSLSP